MIITGDALTVLRTLDAGSVQCCVTSPPYWGLRDYGIDGQLGLEPTPEAYVTKLVEVFAEVRRVLRDDGTLWLNLGDSYAGSSGSGGVGKETLGGGKTTQRVSRHGFHFAIPAGLKPKDLVGIPWRVAFALPADGWYLRSELLWHKPNPMPESVTDRPTKAHEYLFLLTKSARYYYDADAVREPHLSADDPRNRLTYVPKREPTTYAPNRSGQRTRGPSTWPDAGRNLRTVWTIPTQPFKGAHFATFPHKLVEPCILAGTATGDVVLDPFAGAGTTGLVANKLGREFIGIELNPEYVELAEKRIRDTAVQLRLFGA